MASVTFQCPLIGSSGKSSHVLIAMQDGILLDCP